VEPPDVIDVCPLCRAGLEPGNAAIDFGMRHAELGTSIVGPLAFSFCING
jgi:hypothetical protein